MAGHCDCVWCACTYYNDYFVFTYRLFANKVIVLALANMYVAYKKNTYSGVNHDLLHTSNSASEKSLRMS